MASSYPGGLDNFSTSHQDNVDEIIHASTINDNADAINKIEAELGTNPKGSSADVKTRLGLIQPLTGATAATRFVGATTSGAPVSGTFAVGDYIVTQDGHFYICTVAGSPGTWTQASGGSSSPLTTKGDVWGFSTVDARIPVGSDGQVLTADSTKTLGVKWAAAADGDTLNTVASSGATLTINEATADVWDITLTANCTFTLSSVTSGIPTSLFLVLHQDATGSRTVTWPASVKWVSGYAPVLQTAASAVDFITLYTEDGGTTWYAWYESGGGPGSEIGYDQITSPVTIISSTESSGTTIITCAAHVFDGGPVIAEFFCPYTTPGGTATDGFTILLFEGATQIGRISHTNGANVGIPLTGKYRFTPSAGSHSYTVTGYISGGTDHPVIGAGAPGTASYVPAFIRFTKV